ncbi:MAG: PAS domain-containing protein, partial [Alphaproteobacteria bacterium]|nr:PAS domain-containing protein [Alphaproteobacteria bacterium]
MEYVFFGSTEGLESDQVNAEFGPDAILENLPMAIVLVDPAGRVAYANAMLAEILGRQCADAVGRPLADL